MVETFILLRHFAELLRLICSQLQSR